MPISIKHVTWQEAEIQLTAIRKIVFLVEQQVPIKDEWDDFDRDGNTLHFLLEHEKEPIGTARVLLNNETLNAKIGRLAILKPYRHKGYALQLMRHIITVLKAQQIQTISLDSQSYICELYEKLGFTKQGGIFIDAGIEHQKMILPL